MERTLIKDMPQKIGEEVKIYGWVNGRRDHGKIVFLDLRDRTGIIQLVLDSSMAEGIKSEYVLETKGLVKERPQSMINPKLETGKIEIGVKEISIINKAETLPFDIGTIGLDLDEEIRLRYRYLDLRRKRMTDNLRVRHQFIKFIRNWLDERGFVEIETPILTKATPEGARDFIVPSRLQKGSFYALPQSPQQYKQLLMVAGFERYYQIARCFRDEDPRVDRAYGEFTQLDVELSFPTQEEILSLIEELFTSLIKTIFPKKHISAIPFPRLSYDEAMKQYNTDKPDLRKNKNDPDELAFCWVLDFPLFEWKETENRWDSMHHPFTAPKEEEIHLLDQKEKLGEIKSYQHDLVSNGYEIAGGSIRITNPVLQQKIFKILGHTEKNIQEKFGHLLTAFKYGVPPHGGIAPGIDRILMILQNEPTLREVIAFPTSSTGKTAVMEAPSDVDGAQLKELGIEIKKKSEKAPRKGKINDEPIKARKTGKKKK